MDPTPQEIRKLLDELDANRRSRKNAWAAFCTSAKVITTGLIARPPQVSSSSRNFIVFSGRLERSSLDDLLRDFFRLQERPCREGSEGMPLVKASERLQKERRTLFAVNEETVA
jgi:hypothetical protein